ncbi:MAG: hypothetical protein LKH04_03410 [Lachnospiraceae bacterium]|jgi:hypothetical protein|nr:hypothetical protein [Lachnospiraceae bacterium]MCI1397266.1 hypothetical protein [Lachnospiraceae bacterium]MCI1423339.1 hypothetical protein [Lachnospiraceae bacterium]MCI1452126.1 hypothetical protein [Lachnospiraceae bacterium]
MTRKELAAYLKEHRVPGKLYSLKGGHKNRICLEEEKDGFSVYFGSRKEKVGALHFANEADACLGMRNEIDKAMGGLYGLRFSC